MRKNRPFYLSQKQVFLTLLAAVILHLVIVVGVRFSFEPRDEDVPYRTVHIRLGQLVSNQLSGEVASKDRATSQQQMEDSPLFPSEVSQAATASSDVSREKQRTGTQNPAQDQQTNALTAYPTPDAQSANDQTMILADLPTPSQPGEQRLQQEAQPKRQESGHVVGNDSAVIRSNLRYSELLSGWVTRFQVSPRVPVLEKTRGDLYIVIDRLGNITDYRIEKSTGSPVLDRAILQMVADAGFLVPRVPEDYKPDEQRFAFRIPITFFPEG